MGNKKEGGRWRSAWEVDGRSGSSGRNVVENHAQSHVSNGESANTKGPPSNPWDDPHISWIVETRGEGDIAHFHTSA